MPPHVFGHWGLDCQATNHGLSLCANRIDSQTLISTVVILLDEIFLILKQSNLDTRRQKAWKQIVLLPKGRCFNPPCFQALFNWSRNVSNVTPLCVFPEFFNVPVYKYMHLGVVPASLSMFPRGLSAEWGAYQAR